MKAVELVDKLAESGTGTSKLAVCREFCQKNHDASAADLIAEMERSPRVPKVTVTKAKGIAGLGDWPPQRRKDMTTLAGDAGKAARGEGDDGKKAAASGGKKG